MTTYTLSGFAVTYDINENPVAFDLLTMDVVFPEGTAQNITYTIDQSFPGEIPVVDITGPDENNVRITINNTTTLLDTNNDAGIGFVTTAAGTHAILVIEDFNTGQDYIFNIGDTPLTMPTNLNEFIALMNTLTGEGEYTSGPFAPNTPIAMSTLLNTTFSENDTLIGTFGNDIYLSGDGNDFLSGLGGDDSLNPGDNAGGWTGFDAVDTGAGNDTVNFGDMATGWVSVNHQNLSGGTAINALINGVTNIGTVTKGGEGTDTLLNVANPLNAGSALGGLSLRGTDNADTINATVDQNQWMEIIGLGGNDAITIAGAGLVRLSYHTSNGSVVADLGAGTVTQDGFTDTITGNAWELRGGNGSDSLTGSSADESFIGRGGTDTINGGGGFDRVRYDRPNNDSAVNADLGAGTVTGTWGAVVFSHQVSNIEHVRGTTFGDTMTGSGANERFEGKDGDDTLTGGLGNDTLMGGTGADSMDGGAGTDVADYSDATGRVKFDLLNLAKNTGDALGDTYTSIEVFTGSAQKDTFLGNHDSNVLNGELGNDDLRGRSDRDTLNGGDGNDRVDGGKGRDRLNGDDGNDNMFGLRGPDNMRGGWGDDTMDGGTQNDLLLGGRGSDVITGGLDNDTMMGNQDSDIFIFGNGHGVDVISDFDATDDAEDLDVSAVTLLATFADVTNAAKGNARQVGNDVLIDTGGGNSIQLNNVLLGDLDAADFTF